MMQLQFPECMILYGKQQPIIENNKDVCTYLEAYQIIGGD
jgi:hypothetical protein